MQSIGIDFAGAVALPYQVGERAAGVQLEEARSFVEGRHEQAIAIGDGRGDGESVMDAEGVLPVGLPGSRVERGDGPGMPDDELGPAADLDQQRGVIAGLPVRGKGAPALLAGDLVKSHDLGIGLASDQGDEQAAVDQGRAGDAPGGDLRVVVGDVVLAPD